MAEPNSPTPLPDALPTAPPNRTKIFFRRLASSVALWSFVLAALFSGNSLFSDILFLLVMLAIAGLGLEEFYELVQKAGYERNPLERHFRNIHVAVQHAAGLPAHMEAAGKALLGLRPTEAGW